jgi:NAD+ diphosphatase
MADFRLIDPPTLSRSTIDRADELRDDSERLRSGWSSALVLLVDKRGGFVVDDGALRWTRATEIAPEPPTDAVFLGLGSAGDLWAMRVDELDGTVTDARRAGGRLSADDAGLLATALGVLNWHAAAGFSPVTGEPTTIAHAGWVRRDADGVEEYPRTDPAIITVVHDGADRVLLGRQAIWPAGWYSTLAGFVEPGESLEQCVIREVYEEVGVRARDPRYLGSQPWPFPRSLMLGFEAQADPDEPLDFRDGEIEDAKWFDRSQVIEALEAGREWRPGDSVPDSGLLLPGNVSIAHMLIRSWAFAGA